VDCIADEIGSGQLKPDALDRMMMFLENTVDDISKPSQ
jgi:hypothetical protein